MKVGALFVVIVITVNAINFSVWNSLPDYPVLKGQEINYIYIKKRMRYHGCRAVKIEGDKYYFYRDGKKLKL